MPRSSPQPDSATPPLPRVDDVVPAAALPTGEVELTGICLGPHAYGLPAVYVDGDAAHILMSRPSRLAFRVPGDASTGLVEVRTPAGAANAAAVRVARKLAGDLHPVTSPAVSRSGMVYATISGPRGKQTPVSVMRISVDGRTTPFVTGLLNATGLAFSPAGDLYVTSRAEGSVYRVDAAGEFTLYVEGMGVATGAAFDAEGNLFVGDRSGTIFKINPEKQIFVHATLEPSVAAYHLAVNAAGTLFATAPSLSSNEAIWAIEPNGDTRAWYRGLGRPQGLAISREGDVYLAACLHGRHGVVRVTPAGEASLVLAGESLVGIAFSPLGTAILATSDAVYDVDLGVEGLNLF
jgi:sugar lactone lactonase YvrE